MALNGAPGWEIQERYRLSFWDAMIVAAANASSCRYPHRRSTGWADGRRHRGGQPFRNESRVGYCFGVSSPGPQWLFRASNRGACTPPKQTKLGVGTRHSYFRYHDEEPRMVTRVTDWIFIARRILPRVVGRMEFSLECKYCCSEPP